MITYKTRMLKLLLMPTEYKETLLWWNILSWNCGIVLVRSGRSSETVGLAYMVFVSRMNAPKHLIARQDFDRMVRAILCCI